MEDNSFSKATLLARMNNSSYTALLNMKTNYGGNFLSGLPTNIVSSASAKLSDLTKTAVSSVLETTAIATTAATSVGNSIANTANTVVSAPNAILDFTTVAILDLTEKVQLQIVKGMGIIMQLPSMSDITDKSAEYLSYYLYSPEDVMKRLLMSLELILQKLRLKQLTAIFDTVLKNITEKIGKIKEFVQQYVDRFTSFVNMILEYATKGVDFLCEQIALVQLDIICSISDLLYGGDSRLRMQIELKGKQIEEYKNKITILLRKISRDGETSNLVSQKARYEQKITQLTDVITKLYKRLEEKENCVLLQNKVAEIRKKLQEAESIEEKDLYIHELINAEAAITAHLGYVGYILSKKEIAVNNLAARIAKTTAEPINKALESSLKKALDLIATVIESAQTKIKSSVLKAELSLELLSS